MEKVILHCDLNNFYASVEQILHPELQGHPIAVCGDPKKRHGIVLAKNMIAKMAGVKTGDTLWQAKISCPDIIFVPPTFDRYVEYSEQVFDIYTEFTDRVESFGMDECWLDCTASVNLLGNGKDIADKIRQTVKERTGLTLSIGVSFTKVLAKLGSDMKKPDATTVLNSENYKEKCYSLPVSDLIMVGRHTKEKLELLKIKTIGDLAKSNVKMLEHNFGIVGKKLHDSANGIEDEEVRLYYDKYVPKSVSNGTTTPRDMMGEKEVAQVVYALSEMVAMRLRKMNAVANGVSASSKNTFLQSISRQTTIPPTSNADDIAKVAIELLRTMNCFKEPIRAVTVGTFNLENTSVVQMCLFNDKAEQKAKLDLAIDKIRARYGYHSIKRGVTLNSDLLKNDMHEEDNFKPFKR